MPNLDLLLTSGARLRAAALATAALALAPASATAKDTAYVGRTADGHRISFVLSQGWVERLRSSVTVSCRSTQGEAGTRRFSFAPAFDFRLGTTSTAKETVGYPLHAYPVSTRRRGRAISGTIGVSYAELTDNPVGIGVRSQRCSGRTRFTARPRRGR